MAAIRQQLLYLQLASPSPSSPTVGWALYDGSLPKDRLQMTTGDSDTPLYASALDAMRDGWNVIQVPQPQQFPIGRQHELGAMPYEFVLERKVPFDGE